MWRRAVSRISGTEHDQERHRERGEGGDQRVADRFQPQPVPRPRFDHRIGAVERDPQRLDAVGGEIDRQHRADGQDVAARRGQHVVDFARQRVRDLLRPDLQQQLHRAVGEFLGAEKAGQRRQHDQEREQRHQRRQRDMARDRPAVIGQERIERLHHDEVDVANEPHISPRSGYGDPVPNIGLASDITGLKARSSIGCASAGVQGIRERVEVGACRCYVAPMTSFLEFDRPARSRLRPWPSCCCSASST